MPPTAVQFRPAPAVRTAASVPLYLSARLVDAAAAAAGWPVRARVRMSASGLLRGQVDSARAVVAGVGVAGLALRRVDIRARHVRVVPGLPPRITVGEMHVGALIRQEDLDAWTKGASLPLRLRFRPDGIVARAGFAGVRLGEVVVDLSVDGQQLRLVPRRGDVLGVGLTNPATGLFRLLLPLPPLPSGARLSRVVTAEGTAEVWFSAARLDQELTPAAIAAAGERLRRVVRLSAS